eukprot:2665320-Amphidinium_carterae.1
MCHDFYTWSAALFGVCWTTFVTTSLVAYSTSYFILTCFGLAQMSTFMPIWRCCCLGDVRDRNRPNWFPWDHIPPKLLCTHRGKILRHLSQLPSSADRGESVKGPRSKSLTAVTAAASTMLSLQTGFKIPDTLLTGSTTQAHRLIIL